MVSWRDIELKVVGDSQVDIDRLKEMTQYVNCTEKHEVVKRFWRVLNSLTNDQKKDYLRYVWGRIRLPPREEKDVEYHQVQLDEARQPTNLPFGRTCYFKIELPPYKTDEQLRNRLLYALQNCTSIDGDDMQVDYAADEQPGQVHQNEDENSEDEEIRRHQEMIHQRDQLHHDEYGSEGMEEQEEEEE